MEWYEGAVGVELQGGVGVEPEGGVGMEAEGGVRMGPEGVVGVCCPLLPRLEKQVPRVLQNLSNILD